MSSKKNLPATIGKDDETQNQVFKPNRTYSVIVWGATGFTGNLVCKHIAKHYPGKIKWALAGRSSERLERVREELAAIDPSCSDVPILTADISDPRSLDRLVKQSDVLVSTAGPFWNIGTQLVEASLRNTTHYCDIAGEVHWMRKTIRNFHVPASSKGVKIVHSCGFDSAPSDLGTYMLVEHMRTELRRPTKRVNLLVNEIKSGQSGGSIQSMFEQYMQPEEEIAACNDPYCLNHVATPAHEGEGRGARKADVAAGNGRRSTPKAPSAEGSERAGVPARADTARQVPLREETDQYGVRYNKLLRKWTYPFQFSPINSRVVRRSNSFLHYSPEFIYSEACEAEGPVDAMLGAMGHTTVHLFTTVPFLRALVIPFLPKPGDGPPAAFIEKNHWSFTLHGWTLEAPRVRSKTCQGDELRERGYMQGGVLTPATAMGHVLIDRLRAADIKFEITKKGNEVSASPLEKLKANSAAAAGSSLPAAAANRQSRTPPSSDTAPRPYTAAETAPGLGNTTSTSQTCRCALRGGMAHAHPLLLMAHNACRTRLAAMRGAIHQHRVQINDVAQRHLGATQRIAQCWANGIDQQLEMLRATAPARILGRAPFHSCTVSARLS